MRPRVVLPGMNGPSSFTRNHWPNSVWSVRARQTRATGAFKAIFFSIRSVLVVVGIVQPPGCILPPHGTKARAEERFSRDSAGPVARVVANRRRRRWEPHPGIQESSMNRRNLIACGLAWLVAGLAQVAPPKVIITSPDNGEIG